MNDEAKTRTRLAGTASANAIVFATCMALLFFMGSARAATINVPGDQPTIQAAVNAASAGDTIVVAAGTYNEDVLVNKTVVVQGAGAGSSSVMDCCGMPSAPAQRMMSPWRPRGCG